MKRKLTIALMISFLGMYCYAADLKLPPISEKTLENGLNVVIVENHELPIVNMQLVLKSGSAYDPVGKGGLADFTAGLLRRGTKTRTASQIAEEIDFVGGSLNSSANRDAIYLSCSVLLKHFDVALNLLTDVALNPAFDTSEIERLRNQVLNDIIQSKDDANGLCGDGFNQFLFGEHPYGHPISGTEKSVSDFSRDDINKFYNAFCHPNNAIILVAGDVNPEDIFAKIQKAFGGWKKQDIPQLSVTKPEPPKGYKVLLVDKPDAVQSNIRFGNMGITRNNPDYYGFSVMNYILGVSFTSRLNAKVRVEAGLTYDIRTVNEWNTMPAAYYCNTFTENDSTLKAIRLALDVIKGMGQAEVTDQEYEEAINFWSGYYPMTLETPSAVANEILKIKLYGLPVSYIEDFTKNIRKVTKQDVLNAARKYIDSQNLVFCVVSNAQNVQEGLKALGPVTVKSVNEM